MKFLKDIVNVTVRNNKGESFIITSTQYYEEDELKVIFKCAEEVPQFVRGYMCDFECVFDMFDKSGQKTNDIKSVINRNLLLVYINKICGIENMPEFTYVFYK